MLVILKMIEINVFRNKTGDKKTAITINKVAKKTLWNVWKTIGYIIADITIADINNNKACRVCSRAHMTCLNNLIFSTLIAQVVDIKLKLRVSI